MQDLIKLLSEHSELRVIDEPLDIYLEIPHLAYLEVKKPNGGKALLFTHPISKTQNKTFDIPVLMNIFGSHKRLELIFAKSGDEIAKKIESLLDLGAPKGLRDKLKMFQKFLPLRHVFPKKKHFFKPASQEVVHLGDSLNLYDLPILTTWPEDASAFITMGQIYTQSLDGSKKNLGMYRLQVYDKNHLGLHWQIHKDSQHFFHEYKRAGVRMPVSIALGGDALYTWCGQAPLPYGMYELMLYGLIRERSPEVSKCITNDLYVPSDADIVIEGWVDTKEMRLEGPFGDHTGFYTPIEPYPVLEVSAITHKKSPIFPATVVGKPPLEDKYMGHLTERIFLPLLKKTAHSLQDMYMPENGVFHNLIFVRMDCEYPGHAKQLMHALFGIGQMSFVKHAILVAKDAPDFKDPLALGKYILERLSVDNLIITEGICDALDHASLEFAYGGKLGIDATGEVAQRDFELLDDEVLCERLKEVLPESRLVVQYFKDTKMPIAVVGVRKKAKLDLRPLKSLVSHLGVVVFVDEESNDLYNPYMLVWRVVNNIDAKRDVLIIKDCIMIDATNKGVVDGFLREWPKETDCSLEVLVSLREKKLLDGIDSAFLKKYHIYNSPRSEEKCQL